MPAAAPSKPISATTARGRCRARRSRAAAGSRSRRRPADEKARSFRTAPRGPGGAVGGQDYDGPMGLALVVGPANAGKVALLLDRYLDALDRDPVLIVPTRSDVDRVERDLLRRRPALLSGTIGTFDDLFERLAYEDGEGRPLLGAAQRALLVRRAVGAASLNGLGRSARFAGFADTLAAALAEVDSGLLDPDALEGDLGRLAAAYRAELDRLGLWDRGLLRRRAVERLAGDLAAWRGQPVFAYGFEDLTGAQWSLLEALAGRAEVHVSLPYEPGRPAFASLERTATDLARLRSAERRVGEEGRHA